MSFSQLSCSFQEIHLKTEHLPHHTDFPFQLKSEKVNEDSIGIKCRCPHSFQHRPLFSSSPSGKRKTAFPTDIRNIGEEILTVDSADRSIRPTLHSTDPADQQWSYTSHKHVWWHICACRVDLEALLDSTAMPRISVNYPWLLLTWNFSGTD